VIGKLMTSLSPSRNRQNSLLNWQPASWDSYVRSRDQHENAATSRVKLFFYKDALLVDDMGWEGINHATVRELFGFIFLFYFSQYPQRPITSLGGCLFEKEGKGAGSPDLVVYAGDNYPQWQAGESRKIDLEKWRVPDLVGEVSDTTLALDLDQKKQLYAAMGIAEYWVVDVRGQQVFLFLLDQHGQYREASESALLSGVSGSLLERTLLKLETMTNMEAANWFQQQIAQAGANSK
jgi:Uma2 family endonuclease